jgi:hypothetical protein
MNEQHVERIINKVGTSLFLISTRALARKKEIIYIEMEHRVTISNTLDNITL